MLHWAAPYIPHFAPAAGANSTRHDLLRNQNARRLRPSHNAVVRAPTDPAPERPDAIGSGRDPKVGSKSGGNPAQHRGGGPGGNGGRRRRARGCVPAAGVTNAGPINTPCVPRCPAMDAPNNEEPGPGAMTAFNENNFRALVAQVQAILTQVQAMRGNVDYCMGQVAALQARVDELKILASMVPLSRHTPVESASDASHGLRM